MPVLGDWRAYCIVSHIPRPVKYPEYADLPPKEKHAAQKKRWFDNKKQDPEEAERIRNKNAENKRHSCAHQLLQKQQGTGGDSTSEQPPAKQHAGPSDTSNNVGSPKVLDATLPVGPSSNTTGPAHSAGPADPLHITELSTVPDDRTSTAHVTGLSNVVHDLIPIDPVLLDLHKAESCQYANISVTMNMHSTCDACAMTELSLVPNNSSLPENDPIPPSPLCCLSVNNDLASHMLGSEVPKESETIQWSDGSITVVPCILKDGVNLCWDDVNTVKNFAKLPESRPGSEYVEHVHSPNGCSKPAELRKLIMATLRKNRAIVIREMETPEHATLNVDYLEDHYGVSPYMCVVIHDVEECTKDYSNPYKAGTIEQFIGDIHDPSKIQCVLDVPSAQGGLPPFLRWNQTTNDCPVGDQVHPDNFTIRGWSLFHHGRFLTYPHYDSDGSATCQTLMFAASARQMLTTGWKQLARGSAS
ncbi:hypothetical protein DFJ58DRAFT_846257 [Suillus subalutaceus]|uniref:uncharacterized protein n=1 Tax=Suillus subalutaceus TaxID=48586 RepID=UPI001B861489|nr:uncharacterized protein DFJ58DRAFT_846257 [Suillus subalutaceus]KAG1837977.1 hypothetical protein DFJ58DRAFT_846257 [Suillus subalutaceus]